MTADRAKLVFLGAVTVCAAGFVLLIYQLPMNLRDAVILWVIFGLPTLFFISRVYRGFVQITLERLSKAPQQPPVITSGVGDRGHQGGHELRIITGTDGKRGRRLL